MAQWPIWIYKLGFALVTTSDPVVSMVACLTGLWDVQAYR